MRGDFNGVPYTLSEDGRLVVGSKKDRAFVRLPEGADVMATVAKLAAGVSSSSEQAPPLQPASPGCSDDEHTDGLGGKGSSSSLHEAGTSDASVLNPCTQPMDFDDDDDLDRSISPVQMATLEPEVCLICASEDKEDCVEFQLGFCCADCIGTPQCQAMAEAELAARAEATKQSRPQPPRPTEPRRSTRPSVPVQSVYDVDRQGKGQPGWSAYDLERAGKQHARVREESYAEVRTERDVLREQMEAARREHGELATRLDDLFGRLKQLAAPETEATPDVDCDVAAAVMLQQAISELVEEFDFQQPEPSAPSDPDSMDTSGSKRMVEVPFQSVEARTGGPDGAVGQLSLAAAPCTRLARNGTLRARTGLPRFSVRPTRRRRIW